MEVVSNILLLRKISLIFSVISSLENGNERLIDTNMEAIKDAEKIINPLLNKDHLDEADKERRVKC